MGPRGSNVKVKLPLFNGKANTFEAFYTKFEGYCTTNKLISGLKDDLKSKIKELYEEIASLSTKLETKDTDESTKVDKHVDKLILDAAKLENINDNAMAVLQSAIGDTGPAFLIVKVAYPNAHDAWQGLHERYGTANVGGDSQTATLRRKFKKCKMKAKNTRPSDLILELQSIAKDIVDAGGSCDINKIAKRVFKKLPTDLYYADMKELQVKLRTGKLSIRNLKTDLDTAWSFKIELDLIKHPDDAEEEEPESNSDPENKYPKSFTADKTKRNQDYCSGCGNKGHHKAEYRSTDMWEVYDTYRKAARAIKEARKSKTHSAVATKKKHKAKPRATKKQDKKKKKRETKELSDSSETESSGYTSFAIQRRRNVTTYAADYDDLPYYSDGSEGHSYPAGHPECPCPPYSSCDDGFTTDTTTNSECETTIRDNTDPTLTCVSAEHTVPTNSHVATTDSPSDTDTDFIPTMCSDLSSVTLTASEDEVSALD